MILGILSDTHGSLPEQVIKQFTNVDAIIHAGDIGNPEIISTLEQLAPVYAVYGNIDTWPILTNYPRTIFLEFAGRSLYVIHDITSINYFRFELFKRNLKPELVIYGHTHIPGFEIYQHILFLNPGSASRPKAKNKGTIVKLDLSQEVLNPEFIEIKSEHSGMLS